MLNQRVPVGFLELLGIKAGGMAVPQTSEFLQPTIDLRDFYGSILWGTQSASVSAAAPPANVAITVPDGEIWFLTAGCLITNVPVGATRLHQRMSVAPIGAAIAAIVAAEARTFGASAAQLTFDLAWQPPMPWVLRPGSQITGAVIEHEPAGNVDLNFLQVLFYRVPF